MQCSLFKFVTKLWQTDGKSFKFLVTLRQCVCNMKVSGEPAATLQLAAMSSARSSLLAAMSYEVINLFAAILFFAESLQYTYCSFAAENLFCKGRYSQIFQKQTLHLSNPGVGERGHTLSIYFLLCLLRLPFPTMLKY